MVKRKSSRWQSGSSVWSSYNPFAPRSVPEYTFDDERSAKRFKGPFGKVFGVTKHISRALSAPEKKENVMARSSSRSNRFKRSSNSMSTGSRSKSSIASFRRKHPVSKSPSGGIAYSKKLKVAVETADPSGKGLKSGYFKHVNKPIKKFKTLIKGQRPRNWVEYSTGVCSWVSSAQDCIEAHSLTVAELQTYVQKFLAQDDIGASPPSVQRTQNICFKSTKVTMLMTNTSQLPCELYVYDCDPKQIFFGDAVSTLPELFRLGQINENNGILTLGSNDYNVNPFMPELVSKFWICRKMRKIIITPGESYKHVSVRIHNKVFDWNKFQENSLLRYMKNLSHCIIVRGQGASVTVERSTEAPTYIMSTGTASGEIAFITQTQITMCNAQNYGYQKNTQISGSRLQTGYVEGFINPSVNVPDLDGNTFA